MTAPLTPRSARPILSPAARALRLQRIFARMQEGGSYKKIAADEGISRERLRQIVRSATTGGKADGAPDHKLMQIARLQPALRLASQGVADGDPRAIPLLLKLLDRLDRYNDPLEMFDSPAFSAFARPKRRRRRGAPDGRSAASPHGAPAAAEGGDHGLAAQTAPPPPTP
jgi:hypothetical protein